MPVLRLINPATGQLVRELPETDSSQVASAAARAARTQPAWAALGLERRCQILRAFRDLVDAAVPRLAGILVTDMGKPLAQARAEVGRVHERLDFFLANVADTIRTQLVSDAGGMEERLVHEPLGVVANISAWNYPWFVGINVIAPALLCGNAVLYKPSEHATETGLALIALLHHAGVPPDIAIALPGGKATGAALAATAVDGIFFTGSNAAGMKVAQAAAGRLGRVQLELGGKDAVYVADDVDVAAAAAATADGAFYNAGQSCCAIERLFVQRGIYDQFVAAFLEQVALLRVGDPLDPATTLGPLAFDAQRVVLERQISQAVEQGAIIACGGRRAPGAGWFFQPTVLLQVDARMAVMREETFGPVIGIMAVDSDAHAVSLINDSTYGLTAGVYSRDRARATMILAAVDTGTVYWNCCDRVSPRLPWTGRRGSGSGATLGQAGILAMTKPKAYHLRSP